MRQSSDIVAIDDPDVADAVRLIRSRAGQAMNVKEVMSNMLISRRSLEQRFQKILGRTPWEEIIRVRLNKAEVFAGGDGLAQIREGKRGMRGSAGQRFCTASFHPEMGLARRSGLSAKVAFGQGGFATIQERKALFHRGVVVPGFGAQSGGDGGI